MRDHDRAASCADHCSDSQAVPLVTSRGTCQVGRYIRTAADPRQILMPVRHAERSIVFPGANEIAYEDKSIGLLKCVVHDTNVSSIHSAGPSLPVSTLYFLAGEAVKG